MASILSQNQRPFSQIVENARSALRSQALETACRSLTLIPVITQHLWAQPQVQSMGAKITELTQSIPYLEPFTQNFVGSVASIAPEEARSCALILSSMSGASAATARILKAGHSAMMGQAEMEILQQEGNILSQMGEACHASAQSQLPSSRLSYASTSTTLTSSSSSNQLSLPNPATLQLSERLTIVQAQGKTAQAWGQVLQAVKPNIDNLVRSTAQTTGAWHLCTGLLSKLESYGHGTDASIQQIASRVFQVALNVQIARKLYQNVRNASGKWNQVKQLAALGLLGAGVEAIHHVFKTNTLKTAQTLALLTMFPRTTEARMFAQAAVCGGVVGGTLGALREYHRKNGQFPLANDFLKGLAPANASR